jgi:hypothetical protein
VGVEIGDQANPFRILTPSVQGLCKFKIEAYVKSSPAKKIHTYPPRQIPNLVLNSAYLYIRAHSAYTKGLQNGILAGAFRKPKHAGPIKIWMYLGLM